MVIVEPNSCFLQMRKLRARDWPEFVELIGGTPPGLLAPGPAAWSTQLHTCHKCVFRAALCSRTFCRMEMFSLSRMVTTGRKWPLST